MKLMEDMVEMSERYKRWRHLKAYVPHIAWKS